MWPPPLVLSKNKYRPDLNVRLGGLVAGGQCTRTAPTMFRPSSGSGPCRAPGLPSICPCKAGRGREAGRRAVTGYVITSRPWFLVSGFPTLESQKHARRHYRTTGLRYSWDPVTNSVENRWCSWGRPPLQMEDGERNFRGPVGPVVQGTPHGSLLVPMPNVVGPGEGMTGEKQ